LAIYIFTLIKSCYFLPSTILEKLWVRDMTAYLVEILMKFSHPPKNSKNSVSLNLQDGSEKMYHARRMI
jgi:hypothetical protein